MAYEYAMKAVNAMTLEMEKDLAEELGVKRENLHSVSLLLPKAIEHCAHLRPRSKELEEWLEVSGLAFGISRSSFIIPRLFRKRVEKVLHDEFKGGSA